MPPPRRTSLSVLIDHDRSIVIIEQVFSNGRTYLDTWYFDKPPAMRAVLSAVL